MRSPEAILRKKERNRQWHIDHPDYASEKSREWRDAHPHMPRFYRQQRRARLREVPREVVHDNEIFERDGWTCQLCGNPIDPDLRYPHRESASLDHVIPISQPGSSHTRANVQASHLRCNQEKYVTMISCEGVT